MKHKHKTAEKSIQEFNKTELDFWNQFSPPEVLLESRESSDWWNRDESRCFPEESSHFDPVVLNISQKWVQYCWTVENHWTKEDQQRLPSCDTSDLILNILYPNLLTEEEWRSDWSVRLLEGGGRVLPVEPGDDTPQLRSSGLGLDSPAPPVCSPVQPSTDSWFSIIQTHSSLFQTLTEISRHQNDAADTSNISIKHEIWYFSSDSLKVSLHENLNEVPDLWAKTDLWLSKLFIYLFDWLTHEGWIITEANVWELVCVHLIHNTRVLKWLWSWCCLSKTSFSCHITGKWYNNNNVSLPHRSKVTTVQMNNRVDDVYLEGKIMSHIWSTWWETFWINVLTKSEPQLDHIVVKQ